MKMRTNKAYRQRCSQLRLAIRRSEDAGPFKVVMYRGTRYIYNAISRNIIYKERLGTRAVGIQYRATSIYRPVLERIVPSYVPDSYVPDIVHARRVASPNMRRHVRDVRRLAERPVR